MGTAEDDEVLGAGCVPVEEACFCELGGLAEGLEEAAEVEGGFGLTHAGVFPVIELECAVGEAEPAGVCDVANLGGEWLRERKLVGAHFLGGDGLIAAAVAEGVGVREDDFGGDGGAGSHGPEEIGVDGVFAVNGSGVEEVPALGDEGEGDKDAETKSTEGDEEDLKAGGAAGGGGWDDRGCGRRG